MVLVVGLVKRPISPLTRTVLGARVEIAVAPDGFRRRSVRWYRLNAGLTLDELAARAHVSRNTVAGVEALSGPRTASVWRIAAALDVDAETIAVDPSEVDQHEPLQSLHELREGAGLTALDLARLAEVAPNVVYRAEHGSAVHPHYAFRISQALGCLVTDWYPREGPRALA